MGIIIPMLRRYFREEQVADLCQQCNKILRYKNCEKTLENPN
jgi:hypothetical protein